MPSLSDGATIKANAGQAAAVQAQSDMLGDLFMRDIGKENDTSIASARNAFIVVGVVALLLLFAVPTWNSLRMLNNASCLFWLGHGWPFSVLFFCAGLIKAYVTIVFFLFRYASVEVQSAKAIVITAGMFMTIAGLFFISSSVVLSSQVETTRSNILTHCTYSEQTHELYRYARTMENIRKRPSCAFKHSVEACAGYEDRAEYTAFLKQMEIDWSCAGVCADTSAVDVDHRHHDRQSRSKLAARLKRSLTPDHLNATLVATAIELVLPDRNNRPALFSNATRSTTCEVASLHHLQAFARDVHTQMLHEGIAVIGTAIALGLGHTLHLCAFTTSEPGKG